MSGPVAGLAEIVLWVRETDGYIVYLSFTDSKSSLSMNFDTYNQSPLITIP